MKDCTTELINRDDHNERRSISRWNEKSVEMKVGFSIEKFPKEFKKDIIGTFDKRFFTILLFSFLINVSTILYLEKIAPTQINSKAITKIQERYANLLLDKNFNPMAYPQNTNYELDNQIITGLARFMEDYSFNIFESLNNLPNFEKATSGAGGKETQGYSKEEIDALRKSSAEQRIFFRSELARKVSSIGLLGLISSKGKNIDHEYVQDLLEYASRNSEHLTTVLSKLNTIEVPRYGTGGYARRLQGSGSYDKLAALKGGRKTADKEINNLIKKMQPLSEAKTKTITRNIQYEDINSSYLSKLSNATRAGKKRTSQDVVRVIRSHSIALQDCYKQELKRDRGIKGKIIVRFTINPEGAVIFASMVSSTLNSPRMENCIVTRIRRWRNFTQCDPSFGNKTYRQSFKFGE
ncbi:MAG: AgmX/PglI C-terminal domain-containing protein [Bacteroidales bacterium]|nr:AgmX/PglI C-terminal domain-containing protein [Bacteroidales bacterium]